MRIWREASANGDGWMYCEWMNVYTVCYKFKNKQKEWHPATKPLKKKKKKKDRWLTINLIWFGYIARLSQRVKRGCFTSLNDFYLPALHLEEGGGGPHPAAETLKYVTFLILLMRRYQSPLSDAFLPTALAQSTIVSEVTSWARFFIFFIYTIEYYCLLMLSVKMRRNVRTNIDRKNQKLIKKTVPELLNL